MQVPVGVPSFLVALNELSWVLAETVSVPVCRPVFGKVPPAVLPLVWHSRQSSSALSPQLPVESTVWQALTQVGVVKLVMLAPVLRVPLMWVVAPVIVV